jgi:ATP-dependent DNA ligase
MTLPLPTSFAPMEARSVATLPRGKQWQYEPKWDGFRCVAFRNHTTLDLRSRNSRPLTRYFPEIERALLRAKAQRFVLDGEIVVPVDGELSFDHLLERIHPAASRAHMLARETPAVYVVFDLLVDEDGRDLTAQTLAARRARLGAFFKRQFGETGFVQLSPCTTDRVVAEEWLSARAGTDGVIAKRRDCAYASGDRSAAAMVKVKRMRTADCVVGGFRWASKGSAIGSLLLGLYDEDGRLHHCGFTSSFTAAEREMISEKIAAHVGGRGFTGRTPEAHSRWIGDRSAEWVPMKPVLVCEVRYDHFSDGRFRHGTKLLRWRVDKAPTECTFDQVKVRRRRGAQARRRKAETRRKTKGVTTA